MGEVILYPDAERAVTLALRSLLAGVDQAAYPFVAGVRVSTQYPPGATPVRHIRVRRSGGVITNLVEDAARLDFQVWYFTDATSDGEDQMKLAQLARGLIGGSLNAIYGGARFGQAAEFVGPGRFDDPIDSAREIVLFTTEIRLRAVGA
jgi:hypothetical protein